MNHAREQPAAGWWTARCEFKRKKVTAIAISTRIEAWCGPERRWAGRRVSHVDPLPAAHARRGKDPAQRAPRRRRSDHARRAATTQVARGFHD